MLGFIGAVLIGLWLLSDRQPVGVEPRTPQEHTPAARAQGQPAPSPAAATDQPAGGEGGTGQAAGAQPGQRRAQASTTQASGPAPATTQGGGRWPWFRGVGRDAIADEEVGLARSWPEGGPRKLWSKKMLGPGHAGAAILGGRVYVLDYDLGARADVLRCMSLQDGSDIWKQSYAVQIKDNHGISRTVPAVTEQFVVSLGPMGHVTCARADSGEIIWQIDLKQKYGTKIPGWYAGQCPLIDDGKAIVAPGGQALMIAVDCASGQVVWQTPNPRGWQMTHTSVMPCTLGGRKVYVYTASGGIVGVSPSDGSLLWEQPGWSVNTANVPSPLPVGNDRLFITGGYGAGSMLLSLAGGSPSEVWRIPQKVFGSHQHTPIYYRDHIFGVSMDQQLVCLNLQGERVWSSGHTNTLGIGPYIIAEGLIYALNGNDGTLVMAEASTSGYKELARAKVLPGTNAWGPMALAGGKLICRDRTTMVCLDVKNP
ncbi:MAG: PQQ-binding-like beta-propeller repeat protein [Armatimonadota bacterium]|nr:PQQ-binding-like beta-propeller repeat protein [Armatimonadota bacterium]